jgi:hypothetical protein
MIDVLSKCDPGIELGWEAGSLCRGFLKISETRLIWLNVFRSSNLRSQSFASAFVRSPSFSNFSSAMTLEMSLAAKGFLGFLPGNLQTRSGIVARTSAQTPRVEPSGC